MAQREENPVSLAMSVSWSIRIMIEFGVIIGVPGLLFTYLGVYIRDTYDQPWWVVPLALIPAAVFSIFILKQRIVSYTKTWQKIFHEDIEEKTQKESNKQE